MAENQTFWKKVSRFQYFPVFGPSVFGRSLYALQLSLFISVSEIRLDFLEFGFRTEKSVLNPNCLETGGK